MLVRYFFYFWRQMFCCFAIQRYPIQISIFVSWQKISRFTGAPVYRCSPTVWKGQGLRLAMTRSGLIRVFFLYIGSLHGTKQTEPLTREWWFLCFSRCLTSFSSRLTRSFIFLCSPNSSPAFMSNSRGVFAVKPIYNERKNLISKRFGLAPG